MEIYFSRFQWRKLMSQVERSLAYPSHRGEATFSYSSLQTLNNCLYEKQNIGSAERVALLAG